MRTETDLILKTARLQVACLDETNRSAIERVYEELTRWRESVYGLPTPPLEELESGRCLPLAESTDRLTVMLLSERQTGEPVGVCAAYEGWPRAGTLFLAMFYICGSRRGQGYGNEFMDAFSVFAAGEFRYLMIRVHQIRRHPPRFFYKQGFRKTLLLPGWDALLRKRLRA